MNGITVDRNLTITGAGFACQRRRVRQVGSPIEHNGKELCLPEVALEPHLKHGEAVIHERGCFEVSSAKETGKSVAGARGRTP